MELNFSVSSKEIRYKGVVLETTSREHCFIAFRMLYFTVTMGIFCNPHYCKGIVNRTMKTITKADIVEKIASKTGLTKIETKAVVDGFLLSLIETLGEGNRVELRGFGVFQVKQRKSRMARNPRTGEPVPLDDRFVPVFKVSGDFQGSVDKSLKSK